MTVVVVPADLPREGHVLSDLAESTPLSAAEAATLYEAMLADVATAVDASGGDLLVNYPATEDLPDEYADADPEAELRAVVDDALGDADAARYEVQVGSTFDARVGNAVTHLLEGEDEASAAVAPPTAPLLGRTQIDEAAMKLRRNGVVLGPTTEGRTYYAGFSGTVDFDGAFGAPAVETLATRATDAGHSVGFLPMLPVVETAADLRSVVTLLAAREIAGVPLADHTGAAIAGFGLRVEDADGGPTLVRDR